MTEKNSEFSEFIRLRQKGLFLFSLLILGFLGFRFAEMNQKPTLSGKVLTEKSITIELAGKVHRPGLLLYSQPPTVQQIIRDDGGVMGDPSFSASEGKEVLFRDTALIVEAVNQWKNTHSTKAPFSQGPLDPRATHSAQSGHGRGFRPDSGDRPGPGPAYLGIPASAGKVFITGSIKGSERYQRKNLRKIKEVSDSVAPS